MVGGKHMSSNSAGSGRGRVVERWARFFVGRLRLHPARRLRLGETLSLGERRFLSIVECDGQTFLIGSTQASIVMLAHLP